MRTIGLIFSCVCALSIHAQYSSLPISLSLPMDHDTIEESEPNFVWQANLSSLQSDPRLSMQLVVVKVSEDQTATEAIVENAPIFIRQGLVSNSLTYSNPSYSLEKGSWYAWQLSYLFNGLPIQQSEVWTFTLAVPGIKLSDFIPLRITNDASIYSISGDRLNVSTKASGDFVTKCKLTDSKGKVYELAFEQFIAGEFKTVAKSTTSTDTRYFSLDTKKAGLKKGMYTLVWEINNTSYTLNFSKE